MFRLKVLFVIMLMSLTNAMSLSADAQKTAEERFIAQVGEDIRVLVAQKSLPQKKLEDGFRKILQHHFNLNSIGKFVLGKYWRTASSDERTQFLKLFEDSIVKTYVSQFKEYSGEQFQVTGSKKGTDGGVVVLSQILRQKPIDVNWFVRSNDGKFLVHDVIVNGVSMSVTQRSEYGSIISQRGNGIQGLNKALRENLNGVNHIAADK